MILPKLDHEQARFFRPRDLAQVPLEQCDTLAIGAHQDDCEILGGRWAYEADKSGKRGFFAVVVTNGAGKPRSRVYQRFSDREMCDLRNNEQELAAEFGRYGGAWMLSHPSGPMRGQRNEQLVAELVRILQATKPKLVVTHNPMDIHPSHTAVYYHTVWAIQSLPVEERPEHLYGGEVWGEISRWHVLNAEASKTLTLECSVSLEFIERILRPFVSQNDIMGYDWRVPDLLRIRAGLMDPYQATGVTAVQLLFDLSDLIHGNIQPREIYDWLHQIHDDAMRLRHDGY